MGGTCVVEKKVHMAFNRDLLDKTQNPHYSPRTRVINYCILIEPTELILYFMTHSPLL